MGSSERDHFWTLSNAVSLLRVVLTLPAIWLIALGPDYVWEAFGVVVVMIVSDWIDGWLARWRGEISQWGKILDPLADKVAVGAITIAIGCVQRFTRMAGCGRFVARCGDFFCGDVSGQATRCVVVFQFLGQGYNAGAEWVAFGLFVGCRCAQARADWSECCVSHCFTD